MRAAYAVQGFGFLLLAGVMAWLFLSPEVDTPRSLEQQPTMFNSPTTQSQDQMIVRSPAFGEGQPIPSKYTCDGENMLPPLAIDHIPEEAVSLVFIMEDPDVPKHLRPDGMWDHWLVWNVPPDTTRIGEGEEPQGIHGTGTNGTRQYHGPCPPDREHRYVFKVYALDTILSLPEGSSKAELLEAIEGHVLMTADLTGVYARTR